MKYTSALFPLLAVSSALCVPSLAYGQSGTSPMAVPAGQTTPNITIEFEPTDAAMDMRVFQLRSIKPSIVAWWLDPQRAPLPADAKVSLSAGLNGDPLEGFRPQTAHLPPDISKLKIADAQNQITAYGTLQALDELKHTLESLDAPLKQVEFEARIIRLDAKAARSLRFWPPVEYHGSKGIEEKMPKFGLIQPDTRKQLESLIYSNRAKIVQAPRLTVTSGLTGSSFSETAIPALLVGSLPNGKPDMNVNNMRTAYMQIHYGASFHPVVRSDGSVLASFDLSFDKLNGHVMGAELRKNETGIFRFPTYGEETVYVALITCRVV